MQKLSLILLLPLFWGQIAAQSLTQTIRGRITDYDSQMALPGANVVLKYDDRLFGAVSDIDGYFRLEAVPVGRHTLQISLLGYEPVVLTEVLVTSGKELVMDVRLKEAFKQLDEVIIKPELRKDKALNNLVMVSGRSFSVEEAGRYAGGWNDPSRLAGSFAGVTMAEGVNDNAIVVRGNAPKGIMWRLEGVEIPAPNHLNGVNNGGGIETVFSVKMLDNSDFITSAFPAEYGNAMSGVFDIGFRNGNNQKRESAFQVGTQGIDVSSEGPFNDNGKSSYLFNYRYSTMGLADKIIQMNVGLPTYQDFSYKLHLPTKTAGEFSVWGIAGLSSVEFEPDDPDKWETSWDNNQYKTNSDMAASGLSHRIYINKESYLLSVLAVSWDRFKMKSTQWQRDGSQIQLTDHNEENYKLTFNSTLNHKFGNRHTNRTGITVNNLFYDFNIKGNPDPEIYPDLVTISQQNGGAWLFQAFTQSKFRLLSTLDLNVGINLNHYKLNGETIAEPRIGVTWRFMPLHSFSLAYGKHSRLEPLRFYESEDENGLLNPDLKITKAHHLVFGYNWLISDILHLKVETYYQKLYDVPVVDGTSESLINYSYDMYFTDHLNNDGTGYNKGIDITLERSLRDGYYFMLTGSFFDSKYKGGDGIERNTSYNRGFVTNILGGKEWEVRSNNLFNANLKISYMGGNRFSPFDLEASQSIEMVVEDNSRAFEWQENNKLYIDLAINYHINRNKLSHVLALQFKNLLMTKEMFGWAYDFKKQMVVENGMAMIYPYVSYRIEF